MNTFFKYIGIALAGFSVAACSIDNYDQPNSWLHGSVVDSETGALVEQDLLTTNGSILRYTELEFTDKYSGETPATTTTRDMNFKTDGTFSDKGFFAGKYRLFTEKCNFFPIDTNIVVPAGDLKLDLKVVPYVRVKVDSIVFNETECNVYAYFKLECPDETVTVKEAALFVDRNSNVSKTLNGAGDNGCKVSINKTPDPNNQYRLKMSTKFMNPVPFDYYFRVGALSGEKQATYNFATAVKLHIDNSNYVEPEVVLPGVQIDACETNEGWGGGFGSLGTLSDCREGKASVGGTANTNCVVFFEKKWAEPIDLKTTIKAGHVKFWYYIASALNCDNGQFEFCSGGGCDNHELTVPMKKLTLNPGWNEVDFPMANGDDGGFDPSGFNYFRNYETTDSGENTIAIDDIRAYAPDVMDNCDAIDGWAGDYAKGVDFDCREGEGCIGGTNTGGTVFFQKKFDTPFIAPVTLTSGQFAFYWYISDGTALPRNSAGQVELCSGGECDKNEMNWTYDQFELNTGWNKVALPMSIGHNGGLDPEACNFIRLYHTQTAKVELTMKLDKIGFYEFPED